MRYKIKLFSKINIPHDIYKLRKLEKIYMRNSIYPIDLLPKSCDIKYEDNKLLILSAYDGENFNNYLTLDIRTDNYYWHSINKKGFRSLKDALIYYMNYKINKLLQNIDHYMNEYEYNGYEYTRIHEGNDLDPIDDIIHELSKNVYSLIRYSNYIKKKL